MDFVITPGNSNLHPDVSDDEQEARYGELPETDADWVMIIGQDFDGLFFPYLIHQSWLGRGLGQQDEIQQAIEDNTSICYETVQEAVKACVESGVVPLQVIFFDYLG